MRTRGYRTAAAILFTIGIWSCRDSTAPDSNCPDDLSSVDVAVTLGATVSFDWQPRCGVELVLVEDDDGGDVWAVASPAMENETQSPGEANKIVPPLTYGLAPAGMIEDAALPLGSGSSYKLVLWRRLPSGSNAVCMERIGNECLIAVKSFTR
jgi:hypothetical protein